MKIATLAIPDRIGTLSPCKKEMLLCFGALAGRMGGDDRLAGHRPGQDPLCPQQGLDPRPAGRLVLRHRAPAAIDAPAGHRRDSLRSRIRPGPRRGHFRRLLDLRPNLDRPRRRQESRRQSRPGPPRRLSGRGRLLGPRQRPAGGICLAVVRLSPVPNLPARDGGRRGLGDWDSPSTTSSPCRPTFPPHVVAIASTGIFIGGSLWSWCCWRFGTIWPAYVSHAIVDVAIFAIGYHILLG